MKLRVQNDRSDFRRKLIPRECPTVMQPDSGERGGHAGNGLSLNLQAELHAGTPLTAADSGEVRVSMGGSPGESSGGASSRRSRVGPHSHSHAHTHGQNRTQHHSSSEPEPDPPESDVDSGEPSASMSELRCLLRWLQKSLPFLIILCAKLVIQHALGLAVGVGLFTTFLYVNKNIQSQVFLQDHYSKLRCIWLLLLLSSSTLLLYYTFLSETLYNCLIFLSPTIEPLGFWETLWAVGITNLIIKLLFMGVKCLILLVPASLVTCRTQGRWLMLTEELGQVHQATAPVPLWFRYLVTYQESDGTPGLTLGVLLALLYLILKLLGFYNQSTSLLKTHTGSAATRAQCIEAGDVCPICQGEYRDPRALICQHIFCDECIALWFNREKICPLCRTVITDKVYKWRDGTTSPHLQLY
ncbi:E3 ubiquitin-protein ligase RNFT1 isoform X2 [Kryptolebias marmoratus]|uniref:E3 ubiquitin-protein ligase RNFT1 isoform X2 n=1 Tax=Kryptolebias marmoratus TaxID=37003 RepID=UPI0007F894D9|nr:E3 ubiquitin-protein ligase RNFT1 isoform X2 [Kryptolebias marmoratus]